MSLPPERISIKRRRQDEPVDTLILEQSSAHEKKKRRFTDFVFQRLRRDEIANTGDGPVQSPPVKVAPQPARDYGDLGIPVVKTSLPGDEVKDFENYRREHWAGRDVVDQSTHQGLQVQVSSSLPGQSSSSLSTNHYQPTRRFHLTRDISSSLRPNASSGIRRPKMNIRPPLATFVERYMVRANGGNTIYNHLPVDSIVELDNKTDEADVTRLLAEKDAVGKRVQISTFQKPSSPMTKRGTSIRDDPTTWDHDSDQLANELAALAFDIDPADAAEPPHFTSTKDSVMQTTEEQVIEPMVVDGDDDFVFETYVRIKHNSDQSFSATQHSADFGVLVIDEENEDLWERYIQGDDDDEELDEEDEDSNAEDNPRNEYPDDEVSTDDEFGRNVYRHRRNASDDEEYDSW